VRGCRWVIAGLVSLLALVAAGGPALADAYPAGNQQPARVLGEKFFNGGGATAVGGGGGGGATGSVAFTGFNALMLVAVALAAIAVGLLLRRAHDRRAAAAD
jgi:hypothetical protein